MVATQSLVLGVGASSGAAPEGVVELAEQALARAGLRSDDVELVATIDRKRAEPGVKALAGHLNAELRFFSAERLATIEVRHPSARAEAATGTSSVAEAAALAAAGEGAELVVEKQRSAEATVAVARLAAPDRAIPEGQGRTA